MTISIEPLRPSDHPLLHTWLSSLRGVRTEDYSYSNKTISLSIISASFLSYTNAFVAKAGGTGQEYISFNRVLGSTLAGDRIDFSGLHDPRIIGKHSTIGERVGVKVNLATGEVVIDSSGYFSWGCLIQNFEDVTGTPIDDILIGNTDSNKIIGGAGIDTLDGGSGNDTLDGGSGVDALTGGSGNDRFILAARGDLNADSITDFKAYVVRSQPDFTLPEISTSGGVILSGDDGRIFTGRPPGGVTPGGWILNDYYAIEDQGNTKLFSRIDGLAFVETGAGRRQEITSPWGSPAGNDSTEWQMMAADTIAGVNQILWRNNTSNFLHTWSLDANWTWQSSSGADGFNTPRAWELETNFQVDGNHDGIIGTPYTTLEAVEDDALILANRLDEGLVGASAAGIKGLTFSGGNGVGNTLAPMSFFKGAGLNGASFGAAAGIFVNTSSGDVFYNDAKEAGSYLIARLGAAGVAGISARDFLLG